MDTSAWAAEAFADQPYFDPMMMINISETCAATRLIQCREMGILMNDVSRKFERSPDAAPDLAKEDFMARKMVVDEVKKWCDDNQGKLQLVHDNEWVPILYRYEIIKTSAKRQRDWGHLVFTDMTLTRFLMVMVFRSECAGGTFSHHDCNTLTKYNADRFMSLLKYLHHTQAKPRWIRATYATWPCQFKLDPAFLNSHYPPAAQSADAKFPPIFHVTPENFTPSLLPGELEKIDDLLVRGRIRVPVSASLREQVTGSKEARPDLGAQRIPRQCAYCEEIGDKSLGLCSRCKLVRYCDRECQKLAWPSHKLVCKKA